MADMNGLKEHHQRITERMQHLMQQPSAMGRDLLLEELRRCYDMVLTMPLTLEKPIVEVPKTVPEPVIEAVIAPAPPAEPEIVPEPEPTPEPVVPPTPVAATEVAEAPVEEVIAPPKPPVTPFTGSSIISGSSAPKPKIEESPRVATAKPERENNEAILAGKLNNKPISDLRSGIPLNEKFGIIRNLFAGNASDFGDAVLKLNSALSVSELKTQFQLMAERRAWDTENESYQIFMNYVDRKAESLV